MRPSTASPRNSRRSLEARRVLALEVWVRAARSSSGWRKRYSMAFWHSSRTIASRVRVIPCCMMPGSLVVRAGYSPEINIRAGGCQRYRRRKPTEGVFGDVRPEGRISSIGANVLGLDFGLQGRFGQPGADRPRGRAEGATPPVRSVHSDRLTE